MPIAVLVSDAQGRARQEASRLLEPLGPVRVYDRTDALRAALVAGAIALLVCELRDRRGGRVTPLLRELAARAASPAVVVWMPLDRAGAREVIALIESRLDVGLALRGIDDLAVAARASLEGRRAPGAGAAILERIAPTIPAGLEAFALLAATRVTARLRVERAAALIGVARRTLESRLRRAGWPAAHTVLGWCCALHAVWRLDVEGERVKQVVAALELGSPSALANLLTRYCGCTARTVRERGGFTEMLGRFEESLGPSR